MLPIHRFPAESSVRERYRRVKRGRNKSRREKERITSSRLRERSADSKTPHTSGPALEKRESIIYPEGVVGGGEERQICVGEVV